ncbi:MAG: hypothetical protein M0Z75_08720, partial [Nitrospiraceae bacterium]|nr:hypothetical protein [Nitrospiraceae bacterium]
LDAVRLPNDTMYKKSVKSLAEAIILQSMEDFWSNAYRQESIEFFKGEGFKVCAEIAGMGHDEQSKVLEMLAGGMSEVLH